MPLGQTKGTGRWKCKETNSMADSNSRPVAGPLRRYSPSRWFEQKWFEPVGSLYSSWGLAIFWQIPIYEVCGTRFFASRTTETKRIYHSPFNLRNRCRTTCSKLLSKCIRFGSAGIPPPPGVPCVPPYSMYPFPCLRIVLSSRTATVNKWCVFWGDVNYLSPTRLSTSPRANTNESGLSFVFSLWGNSGKTLVREVCPTRHFVSRAKQMIHHPPFNF